MIGIPTHIRATPDNFDELSYLRANPDVAAAVKAGTCKSGRAHFDYCGWNEARRQESNDGILAAQSVKIARLTPHLKLGMPHVRRGIKYDFLTDGLRHETGIVDTDAVSANGYDEYGLALIDEFADDLILDCGAGRRDLYYTNVVNVEIVDYASTDIIGVCESLPFHDDTFAAVICVAVLEHVRNPFRAAAEIVRVRRPGGKLLCCVPFLQPVHGYPHHYYNMTPQGLRALFDRQLRIDDQKVIYSILPVWSLRWIVNSWADGLEGQTRTEFLELRLRDLLASPLELLERPWVRELSEAKNWELASASLLFAHKP